MIQSWKDGGASEDQAARELERLVQDQAEGAQAVDRLLDQLEALDLASAALDVSDRGWFVEALQDEMARLGDLGALRPSSLAPARLFKVTAPKALARRAWLPTLSTGRCFPVAHTSHSSTSTPQTLRCHDGKRPAIAI